MVGGSRPETQFLPVGFLSATEGGRVVLGASVDMFHGGLILDALAVVIECLGRICRDCFHGHSIEVPNVSRLRKAEGDTDHVDAPKNGTDP